MKCSFQKCHYKLTLEESNFGQVIQENLKKRNLRFNKHVKLNTMKIKKINFFFS